MQIAALLWYAPTCVNDKHSSAPGYQALHSLHIAIKMITPALRGVRGEIQAANAGTKGRPPFNLTSFSQKHLSGGRSSKGILRHCRVATLAWRELYQGCKTMASVQNSISTCRCQLALTIPSILLQSDHWRGGRGSSVTLLDFLPLTLTHCKVRATLLPLLLWAPLRVFSPRHFSFCPLLYLTFIHLTIFQLYRFPVSFLPLTVCLPIWSRLSYLKQLQT